jgi:predicted naringenin-chalcone synthase
LENGNSSFITGIGTANPEHRFDQMAISEFMAKAHQLDVDGKRRLSALYHASGIKSRYTVIPDYGIKDPAEYRFFPSNNELKPFPGTAKRMKLYEETALGISFKAVQNCLDSTNYSSLKSVTHLITVSCTGMYAPGLDIDLVEKLELPFSTQRTMINFMGCYAAFNAIKMAHSVVNADPNAKVLVVCTELCTIHFQSEPTENNLLANALFGDGSAALLLEKNKPKGFSLQVNGFFCDLAPIGKKEMHWKIGDHGYEMLLTPKVPDFIKLGIKQLYVNLMNNLSQPVESVDYFAIHPGGKKILAAIEDRLEISSEDNRFAYQVLREYGNMSSPTVLFVLKAIMDQLTPDDNGKNVLSFAFGPGLTLESMFLTVHYD